MTDWLLCSCAVGAQARLMSQALRKIAGNASKCNCTIIFLNQLRHKVRSGPCIICQTPQQITKRHSAIFLFTCPAHQQVV